MATYNLIGMATINISLRVVQRSVDEFIDILSKNPSLWLNVVDRKNKTLFVARLPDVSDSKPYRSGDTTAETVSKTGDNLPVVDGDKAQKFAELKKQLDARANPDVSHRDGIEVGRSVGFDSDGFLQPGGDMGVAISKMLKCDKCKKPSECRRLIEDGLDYFVCEECAKKAKLNWKKLEKLT